MLMLRGVDAKDGKLGEECIFREPTIAGRVVSQVVVRSIAQEGENSRKRSRR